MIVAFTSSTEGLIRSRTREHQKLAGQLGGPPGRLTHLGQVGLERMVVPQLLGHEIPVGEDDGEQVVEVVRDASSELAHRLPCVGLDAARSPSRTLFSSARACSVMAWSSSAFFSSRTLTRLSA